MPNISLPSIAGWAGQQPHNLFGNTNIGATGGHTEIMFTVPLDQIYQITNLYAAFTTGTGTNLHVHFYDSLNTQGFALQIWTPAVNTSYGGPVNCWVDSGKTVQSYVYVATQPMQTYYLISGLLYKRGEGVLD